MNRRERLRILWTAAVGLVLTLVLALSLWGQQPTGEAGSVYQFIDVREQTLEFHAFNREIQLTAEQQVVMREALTALKAPCCADKTALTCCCQCNMARSWWGLSKHLIAERGLGADEVRTAVREWMEFINPGGFTGNACYIGRCSRPFHDNGCGGMNPGSVNF